jgi:hypothetical protein
MNALTKLTAQEQALVALNAFMDTREAVDAPRYRRLRIIQGRSRRRAIINANMDLGAYDDLMTHLSSFPAPRRFNDLGDAIGWFRREKARQIGLCQHNHYAFSNNVLREVKDRLVIARFFARFGAALWAEEAS